MSCNCEEIIIEVSEEGVDGNGIVVIELISTVGLAKTYRITFTNGTHFDYIVTDGSSIASITKSGTNILVDTYTVTLTDGSTTTFQVTNGRGISSIVKGTSVGLTDNYTIHYNDGTTSSYQVTNGKGISKIELKSSSGLVDTYRITYNNGARTEYTVTNGKGISNVEYVSSSGLVDTYRITFNDGTSTTFDITNGQPCTHSWNGTTLTVTSASGTSSANLKGAKGDAATIAVGTVTTGAEGSSATVTNSGTTKDAVFNFSIPRGNTGNGISSIALKSTSGLDKTYRVTYTNGNHFDFVVHDGNGIASVALLSTSGATDTYRITFTDGTHFDYDVVNGSDEWGAIVGDLEDQEDLIGELWLFQDSIEDTVQTVTFGTDGKPSTITHKRSGTTLRTDSFVWSTNSVTETRTLADGRYITIGTDLATLVTTISEIQEGA